MYLVACWQEPWAAPKKGRRSLTLSGLRLPRGVSSKGHWGIRGLSGALSSEVSGAYDGGDDGDDSDDGDGDGNCVWH